MSRDWRLLDGRLARAWQGTHLLRGRNSVFELNVEVTNAAIEPYPGYGLAVGGLQFDGYGLS
jgi:hypothetical protein